MPHHSLGDLALLTSKCYVALQTANFQGLEWSLAHYKRSLNISLLKE